MTNQIQRVTWAVRLLLIRLFSWCVLVDDTVVRYVGSSETLPPPLSAEEETVLITKLGDGEPRVREMLVERNLRLVVYIARKFESTGIGVEDLVSIGTIGLIKAVNTFDPAKRIKLATYASRCIENEILMYLRKNNRLKSEVSFDEPLNVDWDGNELLLSDVYGTDEDLVYQALEDEVDRSLLIEALSALSGREKRIMELRFGFRDGAERTQKEVADLLGISQSYISRLEKRILSKLRREISRIE
ncbi:MAG: RNA polymerase sporulation sigma factor SigE [Firmicutes bacterium]|jgi:RNA polymerase sporulation-specific sigma factor|nr:RNA polymerase sporulation sigma factor SigE [Bacillota bacterium]